MKKLLTIFLFTILLLTLAISCQTDFNKKIAYIDVNILLENYDGMRTARSKSESIKSKTNAQIDSLYKDFENRIKKYEKERSGMSTKEKNLQEELLNNRQQQLIGYRESLLKKSEEEENRITGKVISYINQFIEDYGTNNDYTYILGATGSGNILFAKESNDITQEVLDKLNSAYSKNARQDEEIKTSP